MLAQSHDTFYRYKSAVDEGGVEALFETEGRLNQKRLWLILLLILSGSFAVLQAP